MRFILKPVTTEKAVRRIDVENTLTFETERQARKEDIQKEVEKLFDVKVEKIRTMIRANKKIAHVRLNKKNPAIDIATKLGMI
ncbi:50S ribosomal protein L23 [Candidatus Pacearchaeota archaeon CG10_big_fil_rev_8_21_14_0_10_34_76]|nr:MAG: 50S ribosomal protein L23 [Candidatus Pacearchaeota archaeon CG10_big_fil_rev_8_21_14_0_10_34_76]